ncbi:MAG: hypothetical protein IT350_14215 [Deltaproteobacteria bacterium]|nr:hypothetical protein [Deltaproteobacteria bacterium]
MFRCAIRVSALAIAITIVYATSSLAADTIETFDEGAFDTEFYIGAGGFALDRDEQTLGANTVLGYGLLDRFSGYLAFGVETNTYLAEGHSGAAFGLFGTLLETDHFDADLYGDVAADGEAMSEIVATPGLELNFDLRPDQALWGLYARVEASFTGEEKETDDPDAETEYETNRTMNHTFGTYVTIAERHQILLEYYRTAIKNPALGEPRVEAHQFALGYNVVVNDRIELVSEFSAHLPHGDEDFFWGAAIGFVGTIPGAAQEP